MKKIILLTICVLSLLSCDTSNQDDRVLITENATIYFDESPVDGCMYGIRTENKYSYTVQELNIEFRENEILVQISYYITDEILNCGFSGPLTVIEIVNIEKIEGN